MPDDQVLQPKDQFSTDYTKGHIDPVSMVITKYLRSGNLQIIEICLGCGSGGCEVQEHNVAYAWLLLGTW